MKKKDKNLETKLCSGACCCMQKKPIQIQLENLGPVSGVKTSLVEIPVSGVNGLGSETSSEEIP